MAENVHNVAFIFIRPTRFTKKLVDSSDKLSLTFFDEKYRTALSYCGKASGYNEDKVAGSGLTLSEVDGVPTFSEAEITIVCRKMYAQVISEDCFFDKDCCEKMYPGKDFHTMYVAEIEKIYITE